MTARTIRLRRPATLSVQDGVFLPPSHLLAEVDRRWVDLCRANPAYFDGRLYHVLGVHRNGHGGAVLHVLDCAYRFLAVQTDDFDLGVRALGVKGIVERDGRYLLGRRAPNVAAYQNLWEFAPAGGVEPGKSPSRIIREELLEETGLRSDREPVPVAVLHDPILHCWELVFRLHATDDPPAPRTSEYSALEWRPLDDLPPASEFSPVARQIADLLSPRTAPADLPPAGN